MMQHKTGDILKKIKQQRPLILNITNFVSADFIANGLLCLGASPIMSNSIKELEPLLRISKAVVINQGTLNDEFITLAISTCELANRLNIPIILDPVGAGASKYRTSTCQELIKSFNIALVRANASEIIALSGKSNKTNGVDSSEASHAAIESARFCAEEYKTTILISGATDIIINNKDTHYNNTGSSMMPNVTGTGCLLSAISAAFCAVEPDYFLAAKTAAEFYGTCGEKAVKLAKGPGSFRVNFLDEIYNAN